LNGNFLLVDRGKKANVVLLVDTAAISVCLEMYREIGYFEGIFNNSKKYLKSQRLLMPPLIGSIYVNDNTQDNDEARMMWRPLQTLCFEIGPESVIKYFVRGNNENANFSVRGRRWGGKGKPGWSI
jgi:hypothetical protein